MKRKVFPVWSKEEKQVLIQKYPTAPMDEILGLLPRRTFTSIKQFAHKLGIKRLKQARYKPLLKQLKDGYEKLTPEKAYLLGVLCGDGYISRGSVGLKCVDLDFVESFEKVVMKVYGLKAHRRIVKGRKENILGRMYQRKSQFVSRVYSKKVVEDLLRYDQTGRGFKQSTWEVPKEIIHADIDIVMSFLKGFFDSEGSKIENPADYNPCRVMIYSTNLKGLLQVNYLILKLGFQGFMRMYRRGDKKPLYYIQIDGKQAIDFLRKVKPTIRRKRYEYPI
jgi:intein/homing endonuclease